MANQWTCPGAEHWGRFLQGQVQEQDADTLEQHLANCPTCLQTLRNLPPNQDMLTESLRGQSTPPNTDLPDHLIRLIERVKHARATGEETATNPTRANQYSSENPTAASAAPPDSYDFLAPPQASGEMGRLGPYRVVQVLGQGGMGIVFQAKDPDLDRFVALKAMKPALAVSDSARKRFLREARTTAAIEHDHIVHIYQVGEDRAVPYLAMQMLKGETLEARLRRERPLPVGEALRISREMAEGLAAAHLAGLIHRDIKPSNIWLEGKRGRVKLLDFGLARAEADGSHLTQTGAVAGTPEYMAPEQAQGEKVDARCDLFSLGCVMYRMCTGALPFKGHNTMSLLLAMAQERTVPPHERNPEVPLALSILVLRLLAKEVSGRPGSAREVIEGIEAIERDRSAPPPLPTLGELSGPSLRSPAEAAPRSDDAALAPQRPPTRRGWGWAVAAAAFFLSTMVFGATVLLRTKDGTLTVTTSEADVKVFVDGEEKITIDSMKAGKLELRPGQHRMTVKRGDEELFTETFTLKSGGVEVIHAEWKPTPPAPPAPPVQVPGPLDNLNAAQIPAEDRFAFQPKELVAVLGTHRQRHFSAVGRQGMALSPDSKLIAVGGEDGLISLFDAATMRRRAVLQGKAPPCRCLAFSADSKTLACGCHSGMQIWDLRGDEPRECPGNATRCAAMAFRPGAGATLATGLFDGTVRLWDVTFDGLKDRGVELTGDNGAIISLAFSGDGMSLASLGATDQVIRRWDLRGQVPQEQRAINLFEKGKSYNAVALSPDGKTLAVTDPGTTLRLWDVTRVEPKERLLKEPAFSTGGNRMCLAFSPNGQTVAVGCVSGLVMWDLTGEPKRTVWHPKEQFANVAFSPDGQRLVSTGSEGCVRQWDLAGGEPRERMPVAGHRDAITSLVFDPKEQTLISGSQDSTLRYWDCSKAQPKELATVSVNTYGRYGFVMPSGGQPLAFAAGPTTRLAQLWDLTGRTAKERVKFQWMRANSFSADGNTLAFASNEKSVRVVDTRNEKLDGQVLDHPEEVAFLTLSPNGQLLACSQGEKVRLWNLSGLPRNQILSANVGQVMALTFTPDSKKLVVGGASRGLHIWDVSGETPNELYIISATRNWKSLTFSADGAALAGYNAEGVFLWDTTTWTLRHQWSLTNLVNHIAFVGDSRHLALGNRNGTTYILRLPVVSRPEQLSIAGQAPRAAQPVATPLDQLDTTKIPADERFPWQPSDLVAVAGSHAQRHFGPVNSLAWSPDGKRVASGGDPDHIVYLWDAATMRRVATIQQKGGKVALSPDGKTLAVSSPNPSPVRIFDITGAEPREKYAWDRPTFGTNRLLYSPNLNEQILVTHYIDGRIVLWDLAGGKHAERAVLNIPKGSEVTLAFSSDGKTFAVLGPDEAIRLWDLGGPQPKERPGITGLTSHVFKSVALSPDGKVLALVQYGLPLRVWDLSGDKPQARPVAVPPHDVLRHTQVVAFALDGKTLAVGNRHDIDLWDVTGEARWKATLRGHTNLVSCLAFSPDGSKLASGSKDATVRQWDLTATPPRERFALTGHENAVTFLAFTPGDHELRSAAQDGTVRSWKVESGQLREQSNRLLKGMDSSTIRTSTSGQLRAVAFGGSNGLRTLWDLGLAEPKELRRFPGSQSSALSEDGGLLAYLLSKTGEKHQVELLDLRDAKAKALSLPIPTGVMTLAFSPNGRWLAGGNSVKDDPIYLWDLSTPQKPRLHSLRFPGELRALAFSHDSRTLVATGLPWDLRIWDVSGSQPGDLGTIQTGYYPVTLAFSPDGKSLACATNSGEVILHDRAGDWRVTRRWPMPYASVRALAFAHDNRHLALGTNSGAIYVLRVPTPSGPGQPIALRTAQSPPAAPPLDQLDPAKIPADERFAWQPKGLVAVGGTHRQRHFGPVRSVVWSPDKKWIATGGDDAMIHLWDSATMDRRALITFSPRGGGWIPAFSPDSKTLACGSSSSGGGVQLWDLTGADPKKRGELREHPVALSNILYSPNEKDPLLICQHVDGTIRLWDLSGNKPKARGTLAGSKGPYSRLAISADGKTLVSMGPVEKSIRLWDLSGTEPKVRTGITGLSNVGNSLALSPDGKTLAVAIENKPVRLWDISGVEPKERPVTPSPGYTGLARSVAFSPDGRSIAVSAYNRIELWEVTATEAKRKEVLNGHSDFLWALAFSPDGRTLASGGFDGTVRQWDLTGGKPRERFALTGHSGWVNALAFTGPDPLLLSAGSDGSVRSWKFDSGRLIEQTVFPLPETAGSAFQLSTGGRARAVAFGYSYANSTAWDLHQDKPIRLAQLPGNNIAALSADGNFLAYCSNGTGAKVQIHLMDLRDEKPMPTPLGAPVAVSKLTFSPNGRFLACGNSSQGDPVYLIDLWAKPRPRLQAIHYPDTLRALAFSPDSRTLVAGGVNASLQLWDVSGPQPGDLGAVPTGGAPLALAFSPDGKRLACSIHGQTVVLHDATDAWRVTQRWQVPYRIPSLAFAPDNRHLVLGTTYGALYVLRLTPPSEPTTAIVMKPAEPPPPPVVLPLSKLNARSIPANELFAWSPQELVAVLGTHRQRHLDPIRHLAHSPDGKWIACSSRTLSGSVSLFDAATMRHRAVLPSLALSLAFSADSKTLACGTGDAVVFWDLTGADPKPTQRHHPLHVDAMAFAPVGNTLATGGREGVVRLWDTTGKGMKLLAVLKDQHPGGVAALSFAADGKKLASLGQGDLTIRVCDLGGGEPKVQSIIKVSEKPTAVSRCMALSPDGKTVALGSNESILLLWDLDGDAVKQRAVTAPNVTDGKPASLEFSRDGQTIAVGCNGGAALWDVTAEPKMKAWLPGNLTSVALSSNGRTLVTGGRDCLVRQWDITGKEPKEKFTLEDGHRNSITALASVPGEATLVSGSSDGTICRWDLSAALPQMKETMRLPGMDPAGVWLPSRGQPMAYVVPGPGGRLWDLAGKGSKERARLGTGGVAAFSADGTTLANTRSLANGKGTAIFSWNLREPKPKGKLVENSETLVLAGPTMALSAEGHLLAYAADDAIRLCDLTIEKARPLTIPARVGEVRGLALSPDAKTLVVGGTEKRLQIWDLSEGTPREHAVIPASTHWRALTFSPDGQALVGCNPLEGVFLWDTTTWKLLRRWPLAGVVSCVAFVEDKRHLALGNTNGTIYILRLDSR